MIDPIIYYLEDVDKWNKYYACEALYNIIEFLEDVSLSKVNEIFEKIKTIYI